MLTLFFAIAIAIQVGSNAPDAPAREPQLAVTGSTVALAFGAGKAIYVAMSSNGGKSFAAPVKLSEASIIPLTRHRGPRIAFAGGAIVVTAVVGKTLADGPHAHGLPSDGDLLCWRSRDGGRTWSQGIRVNDVPGAPTEGLHALAADSNGNLFAAWLDHRGGHGTKLYGARSTDGGLTWSRNVQIYESPDGTICECCHPSVAFGPDGRVLVMWRNWLDGSRDMYLARSNDGVRFSKAEKLGTGKWKLSACPMDGGGLVALENQVVSAWRRGHELFMASPGAREILLGDGTDISIALGKTGIFAIWSSTSGIKVKAPNGKVPITIAAKGSFPDIVPLPDGRALAAWEDDGKIVIRDVP